MNEREYKRLKLEIEEEYRENLRALEMVWKRAGKTGSSKARVPRDNSLAHAVRGALHMMPEDGFTLRSIEEAIVANGLGDGDVRRTSISVVLKRMADAGEIVVIEKGSGKRATKYAKP